MNAEALHERRVARFWSRVDQAGGPLACWPWTGPTFGTGYGQSPGVPNPKVPTTAHRLAWIFTHGDPGTYVHPRSGGVLTRRVLHRCPGGPNPLCCNPAHLAVGTDQDNADDRERDGNQARGERMGSAKLTETAVRSARARYAAGESITDLAGDIGVARSTLRYALEGKTWAHV